MEVHTKSQRHHRNIIIMLQRDPWSCKKENIYMHIKKTLST